MARSGEKSRFRDIGQFCLPFCQLELVGRMPPFGDFGKSNDDALNRIVLGAIRQYASNIPGAILRLDLSLDRGEGLQHSSRIGQQSAIGGKRIEIGEGTPDIARE